VRKTIAPLKKKRRELQDLACERLFATKDDEEQWSFLFRTKEHRTFYFIPHDQTDSYDFDPDYYDINNSNLDWSLERKQELSSASTKMIDGGYAAS
jgi:hypothetical protein